MAIANTHRARYSLMSVALAEKEPEPAGVLLEDPATDRLFVRLRRDWESIAPEEAEVFTAMEFDLLGKAAEMGASALLQNLEDTLSNTLTIGDRREVLVEDFERALGRLYRLHVATQVAMVVSEFVSHLPRYSLAVAAGEFLENAEVEIEGWEEAPARLYLTRDMFVARIEGRSMEPLIQDGDLCVFRRGVVGSRQGRLVLVEALGRGSNDRYTVKRYRSEKTITGADEAWKHQEIRLEPLNPEFEAWALDPDEDKYRILAEFVQVLE